MTEHTELTVGINIPWKFIAGHFMCIRSFTRLAQLSGDNVGSSILGTFGVLKAELPNPDVELDQRIIKLLIQNKSDYKSTYRAHLDKGVTEGKNELVLLYEFRRNLFGRPKPCFHIAAYPTGTWNGFFKAVANYTPKEFIWPKPPYMFQPSSTNIFPLSNNIFKS